MRRLTIAKLINHIFSCIQDFYAYRRFGLDAIVSNDILF